MRRLPRAAVIVGFVLAIAVSTVVPSPEGVEAQSVGFPDGEWAGSLSYVGTAGIDEFHTRLTAHGAFDIAVGPAGTDGLWNLQVSSILLEEASASAIAIATGDVLGGRTTSTLEFGSMTVRAGGILSDPITFTADDLPDPGAGSIAVTGGGCNAITGTWIIPFDGELLMGDFVAQPRSAAGSPSTSAADFHTDAVGLIDDITTGAFDGERLLSLLAEAERIAADTTLRRSGCSAETAYLFSNAATALIDTVLAVAAVNIGLASDEVFLNLYRAGIRTGAFDFNSGLETSWKWELSSRLANAVSAGSRPEWEFWLPVAREYGYESNERALAELIEDDNNRGGD